MPGGLAAHAPLGSARLMDPTMCSTEQHTAHHAQRHALHTAHRAVAESSGVCSPAREYQSLSQVHRRPETHIPAPRDEVDGVMRCEGYEAMKTGGMWHQSLYLG
jgi:hypothetical protein